jgi:hypothetical protein
MRKIKKNKEKTFSLKLDTDQEDVGSIFYLKVSVILCEKELVKFFSLVPSGSPHESSRRADMSSGSESNQIFVTCRNRCCVVIILYTYYNVLKTCLIS